MQSLRHFDYIKSIHADYIEQLFQQYLDDVESVDPTWRYFFDGLALGSANASENSTDSASGSATAIQTADIEVVLKLARWISEFRNKGHRMANVNPLTPASGLGINVQCSPFFCATALRVVRKVAALSAVVSAGP